MRVLTVSVCALLTGCAKGPEAAEVGNSSPSTPAILLSPEAPSAADDLVVTVVTESEDADGDRVEYNVVWSVDGEVYGDATALTLPSMFTLRGDIWSVRVTAFDGIREGGSTGASVTIKNSAPTVDGLSVSPAPAFEADTLVCDYDEPVDLDHDEVGELVVWSVDGEELGVEGPITGTHFDKHDAVECLVYADDGIAPLTAHRSAAVVIQNSVPNVTGCSLASNNPPEDVPLEAVSSGSYDEDEDTVSLHLAWYINDDLVSTSDSLEPSKMNPGDNVYVACTAWDGEEEGNTVTSAFGTVVPAH
jgi:hypothetical protein